MGFQHGAELQQQQQIKEQMRRDGGMGPKGQSKSRIRDVWRGNLGQEMEILREMVERYPYISMVCQYALRGCLCFRAFGFDWDISGYGIPRYRRSTDGSFHYQS